jgi:hypothetical protein
VDEVKDAIYEHHPDVVAIELDRGRYISLREKMNGIERDDAISVTKIIKENKVGLFFVSTLLSYFQSKIGADVDVAPGSEMIGAIEASEDLEIPIALIDRDVNVTLQRALNKMGFMEKAKFAYGLLASILGFDDEEDWTDPSYHGLTVSKTGYTEDVNWEGIFNSIVLDKDNYPDDNLMDSTPGTGNIDNDNFNNDSYYDTPPANGSGDIGKDNYGNDGAYDNNIGNVGADKETLPDDDQYDDSAGNGDINKDGYSEDASYDPNNSSDMDKGGYSDDDSYDDEEGSGSVDKGGYSDDESYDKPYGTGGFDKGEHPDEDTSYDLDEGEGDINKEDFSDEQNYDNDNI